MVVGVHGLDLLQGVVVVALFLDIVEWLYENMNRLDLFISKLESVILPLNFFRRCLYSFKRSLMTY